MQNGSRKRVVAVAVVIVTSAVIFLTGIGWGLPSRAVDPFLFGDQPAWSGEKILSLAPPPAVGAGADVDANPIRRDVAVVLNETDAQRAEIIRRYRLMSYQPDEFITLKSLSRIRENRGDPRLYQYGGLWIYPVGAMLKLASILGVIDLRSDQAFYLDHPEAFGRFYVVARLYAAIWGVIGAIAVFWLISQVASGVFLPMAAGIAFALMPVVVNMAHEAKPHLPGAVLVLLTIIAAARYLETGKRRWVLITGASAGAAFGMILTGVVAFTVLMTMVLLRREKWIANLAIAVIATAVVYAVTNPFVVFNAIVRPQLLRSNLGNTAEMYHVSVGGVANALSLVVEGTSPVLTAAGVAGAAFLLASSVGRRGGSRIGWLIAVPAAFVMIQFVLLATNKPAEYGRFALLIDVSLLIAAFAAVGRVMSDRPRTALAALLVAFTAVGGFPYLRGFVRDCRPVTSRLEAAERLKSLADEGAKTIRVAAEPAPYAVPPVDLFRYQLILPPAKANAPTVGADVMITIDSAHAAAPISWTDGRFAIVSPMEKVRSLQRLATRPAATTRVSSP